MIPKIIHLTCLPPYTVDEAKSKIERLAISNPNFDVIVHTQIPSNFIFEELPVFGPEQLSSLLRLDVLRRFGGWYFDLDVNIYCDLIKLENTLSLGKNLAVSKMSNKLAVCTFVSCCPEQWSGWDIVVSYMKSNSKSSPGHYCTKVMGKLLKEKPNLCDYIPMEFLYSNNWLNHKGMKHI